MEDALIAMLNDICGMDLFNSIFETLTVNLFSSGGKYGSAFNMASRLYSNAIMPVAVMLMFIYFMLAMVDKLSQENFQWDQLFRTMAMLLASKYLIEHGFEILKLLSDIGLAFAAKIQSWSGYVGDTSEEIAEAATLIESFREGLGLDGVFTSWLGDLLMFIFLFIPWLGSWVMRLCISIICYTRVIEIYVRATFAPIALADFFHSGMQGTGWRFLKSFMAVCFQGALMLVIAVIFSELMVQIIADDQNLFTFIGAYLAFAASAVMLMFKSLALTKEIVGVN